MMNKLFDGGEESFTDIPSNQITLGPGSYNLSHSLKNLVIERDGVFAKIKITKLEDWNMGIPKFNFFQRLKYLFTGKLKNVMVVKRKLRECEDEKIL